MKRAPLTYRRRKASRKTLARIHEIEREFHMRAFGEELSRINLDGTEEDRHRYLAWMRETARRQGVKAEPKFPYDRDYEEK